MRLINVETLCLEEFVSDVAPPYVILSHTWGNEEVSFQDFMTGNWRDDSTKQEGQEKIVRCCAAAAAEGFAYVWVDTCCIDKTSSAELSEAINSMFRWYYASAICFAYLKDVNSSQSPDMGEADFSKSRWFRRGWTLQELLAPIEVVFFGEDWEEIGTRKTLQSLIEKVTHIKGDVLQSRSWGQCSVAQRMSWAAGRETTRPEDEAYCLLGLFDVNMPLLYGEGRRAFFRLQTEIMKQTDDESIFAWSYPVEQQLRTLFTGMLATSPEQFRDSSLVTLEVDKTRGLRSQTADYRQEYVNTFELVRQLVRVTLPVFGPLVGIKLGPMDDKNHLMSVLDIQPAGHSDTSIHSTQDKGAESSNFSTPKLLLHSAENDSIELLPSGEDPKISGRASPSFSSSLISTEVKNSMAKPGDSGNWQWYIYEPVLVAPLQCSVNGKQIGLLLSRSSFDAKGDGVLNRLHAPSLVCIDKIPTNSNVLSPPRSIYIYGLVTDEYGLNNLPIASKRQEVRISSLLSSGYIGTQDKHTGWSFDSKTKALVKIQSREREEPHVVLFRHISKDYARFPSFFIEVDFSKPLVGTLQESSLPVKSHSVWRVTIEDQSIAEVPAPGTNQYITIKKRELARVQYLNVSIESKNWRPHRGRILPVKYGIRSIINKLQRFSMELDEQAGDSRFPYGFSDEMISLDE
jgi:hypothetical protein